MFELTYNSATVVIIKLYNLKVVLFINYINKPIKIQQKIKISIVYDY
jgi:hypothetical protein